MPLVEKEIIRPGTYWYRDEVTGEPKAYKATPDKIRHMHDAGNKMLSKGLPIPVPCEHDFEAHPMTPADKLKNNAGWVKKYTMKGNALFGQVAIEDPKIAAKLPTTIKWTSPWINSFTDGDGDKWENVISHLALTTRPRITKQEPFPSVAAALSLEDITAELPLNGLCLSRASRIFKSKDGTYKPVFPIAFSVTSGAALAGDYGKKKNGDDYYSDMDGDEDMNYEGIESEDYSEEDEGASNKSASSGNGDNNGESGVSGQVNVEELLCDLLSALGIEVQKGSGSDEEFKRALYNATMGKMKEMAKKGQEAEAALHNQKGVEEEESNPIIEQEQQPMYMSLDEINTIDDPVMKKVALSMYNENLRLRQETEASNKAIESLKVAKLSEENSKRQKRVALLSKASPSVKADLEAMLALDSMALSLGESGKVIDPMEQTLKVLEKGIADMPALLTAPASALSQIDHPTDGQMSEEEEDKLADDYARRMGAAPEERKAS